MAIDSAGRLPRHRMRSVYARSTKPVPNRSPEFGGERFIRTFIYGAYDGQINFLEPNDQA